MNMSTLITRIKLKLGLLNLATPFENINKTIVTILNTITTPTFSIYLPVKETLNVSLNDLEVLEKNNDYMKVLLPDFKTRKLLYVFDIEYNNDNLSGLGCYWGGIPFQFGSTFNQLMLANAGTSLMNQMIPKMTFNFESPRTLYVYNVYASAQVKILLGFEHDLSLASIPETSRDEYYKLALLDVKENLYPTLKMYTEVSTSIGNINLKLDDWASAEDQRRDLLEKWDDTYHLDHKNIYYG